MVNQEYVTQLAGGLEHWNQWRSQHPGTRPDFNGMDLAGMDLRGANLSEADLRSSNLSESNLEGANLRKANLGKANLNGTNLDGANLSGATLNKATLVGANLSGAHFSRTNLSGATLGDTVFARVDLRKVKGLTQVRHWSPSRVVLHTVQLPQDESALHFLRGTGVPEEWVALYSAAMMSPIQYHSCFLCYDQEDETLARRLHADLQDQGIRCWFEPKTLNGEKELQFQIDGLLHLQEKKLLLLSEHSLNSSWVIEEIRLALEKEMRQQRPILFLVCVDRSVLETAQVWATKMRRTCYTANFADWANPQAYQRLFERLLQDLRRADELLTKKG
ncbi:MAG TPA: toll/interleukin-1 receptor domain-containing protein [Ktedonobacteraceae bacterium]